ncbi:unnamed protein product [Lymnaea stagnalis]|uniref:Arf-GAP domain-containing protein n=1 Tax=Lymnaea stagnalis TaxID=6523 RepID=A0AAV2IPB1_LYMST
MSSFKEKERSKELQEKFQAILSGLLKDEDNKYCVDCDAKGPRWASWNLGIFLCIRCAGIHRNLGVHISKVKSVNLDTWTPEQVSMMQEMGNSRARAVYEANIPDGFRRPQTDSALEAFIRSKYEQKKYIAQEWVPPQPRVPKEWLEDSKNDKKRTKPKPTAASLPLTNVRKSISKPAITTPPGDSNKLSQPPKSETKVAAVKPEPVTNSASNDLLGLDLGYGLVNIQKAAPPQPLSGGNELLDLFGGPQVPHVQSQQSAGSDLMNGQLDGSLFAEDQGLGQGQGEKKASTKDSIMALFGGAGTNPTPQVYGVPDVSMTKPNINMYQKGQEEAGQKFQGQGLVRPTGAMANYGSPNFYSVSNQTNSFMPPSSNGQIPGSATPQSFAQQNGCMSYGDFSCPSPFYIGGVYMPPQQMMYPGMVGQQPGMMGGQVLMGPSPGMMAPGMGMMGQPGSVRPPGMIGQPQGMVGNPALNVNPMAMYGGPVVNNTPGMYTPQQMQQLQYQQVQQQMSALQLSQQSTANTTGWGKPNPGQTLSTNLWQ